jgi:hypothetical protein
MSLLFLFHGSAAVEATTDTSTIDGKKRHKGRKFRTADDDLSEFEVQLMQRKLAELKAAKTERERLQAQKQIEESLASISQEYPDAADAISEAATARQREGIAAKDFRLLSRDVLKIGQVANKLEQIAKDAAAEQRRLRDEADIELLVMNL